MTTEFAQNHGAVSPGLEVRIRAFESKDVDGLYFLDQRCYAPPFRIQYHQLVSTLLEEHTVALVMEAGGWKHKGLLGALIVRGEPAEQRVVLVSLMVEAGFRRRKLGSHLLSRARGLAQVMGLNRVVIALEAGNAGGRGFLLQQGFAATAEHAPFFAEAAQGVLWELAMRTTEPSEVSPAVPPVEPTS